MSGSGGRQGLWMCVCMPATPSLCHRVVLSVFDLGMGCSWVLSWVPAPFCVCGIIFGREIPPRVHTRMRTTQLRRPWFLAYTFVHIKASCSWAGWSEGWWWWWWWWECQKNKTETMSMMWVTRVSEHGVKTKPTRSHRLQLEFNGNNTRSLAYPSTIYAINVNQLILTWRKVAFYICFTPTCNTNVACCITAQSCFLRNRISWFRGLKTHSHHLLIYFLKHFQRSFSYDYVCRFQPKSKKLCRFGISLEIWLLVVGGAVRAE